MGKRPDVARKAENTKQTQFEILALPITSSCVFLGQIISLRLSFHIC